VAIGGDVERSVVVQEFNHVVRCWSIDDRRGNKLIHGLVIRWVGRVVHESRAACVDRAGDEGHAHGFVVRDTLECADDVCALKILQFTSAFRHLSMAR